MYEVIVGNVGTVYYGEDRDEAENFYESYTDASIKGYGRTSGESVTIFEYTNGIADIIKEHIGENDISSDGDDE